MKLNGVDLNKIAIFIAVVRSGSYALASEELGLTRSAISQSMTALEAQLGVPLFQRKGRKLYPTKPAEVFYQETSIQKEEILKSVQKLRGEQGDVEGQVRIGAYYEFAKYQLAPVIQQFSSEHPNAQIRLFFDSPSRLTQMMEQGRLDMSFSIFPHRGTVGVGSQKVFSEELVLVASPIHMNKVSDLESLSQVPVIEYYSSHRLLPRWIKIHFKGRRPKIEPKVFAASAEMLIEFVKLGLGVGVVPRYLVRPSEKLHIVRPTSAQLTDFVWLNQFKNQFENSAHKAFYQFVRQRL